MKANIIFETSKDGHFTCYMKESVPDFALFGYGKSAEEARADMLEAYNEIKEELTKEGKEATELEFVWHYDIKSFFDYFNFLNVSKVAEKAGISPSLMRKYTSGVANAGEKQYQKLKEAVKAFSRELRSAEFR